MPRARGGVRGRGRARGRQSTNNSVNNSAHKKAKLDKSDIQDVPEDRYFLSPNKVSPHLVCSICQEVYNEPYRAPCGHSYCKSCIFPWIATNKTCPEDRRTLNSTDMHHDFIVENIIGDYVVACPWRALGCEHMGPHHSIKYHKKNCPLNPKLMPKVFRDYSKQILDQTSKEINDRAMKASMDAMKKNMLKPSSSQSLTTSASTSSAGTSLNSDYIATGSALLDSFLPPDMLNPISVDSQGISDDNKPSTSSADTVSMPTTSVNEAKFEDSSDEDEPSHLPKAALPSLRMRLYMEGDQSSRNMLCDFLESDTTASGTSSVPTRKGRF